MFGNGERQDRKRTRLLSVKKSENRYTVNLIVLKFKVNSFKIVTKLKQ